MLIYSKHYQVILFCPGFLIPECLLHEDDVLLWSTVVALLEASSPAQEAPGLLSISASARLLPNTTIAEKLQLLYQTTIYYPEVTR